jgi:hypothetical protein
MDTGGREQMRTNCKGHLLPKYIQRPSLDSGAAELTRADVLKSLICQL